MAKCRLRHVLLVHVVSRQVARNSCEHVYVAFADRFGERDLFPDVYMEI